MTIFFTFLLLIAVGAIIGGITNYLAIKMLFRPYRAVYVGKFKVPFTPGVIPKRQEDIAIQLGKLVMTHLITADSIERKLSSVPFVTAASQRMQEEAVRFLNQEKTIEQVLSSFTDSEGLKKRIEEKGAAWVKTTLVGEISSAKQLSFRTLIPEPLLDNLERRLPMLSQVIQQHAVEYLASEEGKAKIKEQIDRFFEGRGMMAQMINMFLGNQSLIDKVHPEFLKFLSQPSFREMLDTMIVKEWVKIKEQPIGDLISQWQIDETHITNWLNEKIDEKMSLHSLFNTPISHLLNEEKEMLITTWIPGIVTGALETVSKKAKEWLQALDIEELVADQVRDFSFQELEQVILMISKREFSMITYLGAVLGGLIGLLQGVIMTFIM